jgi:hypothetical protein
VSFAAASHADPIDFDSDTAGAKSEPFTSVDSPIVHFYDTAGNDLQVANFGGQSNNTQALGTFNDTDGSMLRMVFDLDMDALSLDFGNDDAAFTNPGDLAILKLYNDGMFVGMATVVLNRDDLMNQSIGFSGVNFDEAFFYYGNSNFDPYTGGGNANVGLIEIVDNINYRVPEPSLVALSGLGALVVAWRRRRKSA